MIYKNLITHNSVYNKLLSFYKKKHLPNAFIFHGNEGIGKEAHAIEFFGFLNCKKPGENRACGICNSCLKTKIMQHELLHTIVPLPRSKTIKKNDSSLNGLTEKQRIDLTNHFEMKGGKPYHKIELERANTIIINSIRDIKNNINL